MGKLGKTSSSVFTDITLRFVYVIDCTNEMTNHHNPPAYGLLRTKDRNHFNSIPWYMYMYICTEYRIQSTEYRVLVAGTRHVEYNAMALDVYRLFCRT